MIEVTKLTTKGAATYLADKLPHKKIEQWELWLRNNRNNSRKAIYRVASELIGRSAYYTHEELNRFVEFERQRYVGTLKLPGRAAEVMLAFGVGQAGGSTTGRVFDYQISPQIDACTDTPFVQLVTQNPLRIWRLSTDQAKEFASELIEAANVFDFSQHKEAEYITERDDGDFLMMRRVNNDS